MSGNCRPRPALAAGCAHSNQSASIWDSRCTHVEAPNLDRVTRLRTAALAAILSLAAAADAAAAPVLVLDGRRAVERQDRYLPATDLPPPPRAARTPSYRARVGAAARRGPSVGQELDRMLAAGQIDAAQRNARVLSYRRARSSLRRLTGRRRVELAAVMANLDAIAAGSQLTPSRLEPLFQTLDRNRQWWTTGPLITNGRRVSFAGSQVVWQYYAGQGVQLQMLGNFGKANALWSAKRNGELRALLDELVALAADRGGAPAWEYYFRFGGGSPPWTSGMSQGTAVQALSRGAARLGEPSYRDLALRAVALFEQAPPTGVRVETPAGAHYLLYSFSPRLLVLNGFLQAVIGLHELGALTGDARTQALYTAGESEARQAVPRYDTGVWSLYSLEREADVGYHDLVTGFLGNLCTRAQQPVYCDTARAFKAYKRTPPVVAPTTTRIRAGKPARLRFSLDKIARVGMSVVRADGRVVYATSAQVGRGARYFTWRKPAAAGDYTLRLSATDLAGNRAAAEGPLTVLPREDAAKRRR